MADTKKTLGVRVSEQDRAKHQAMADLKGITLSEHLRGILEMAVDENDRTVCMMRAYLQDQGLANADLPEEFLRCLAFLFQQMNTDEKVRAFFEDHSHGKK